MNEWPESFYLSPSEVEETGEDSPVDDMMDTEYYVACFYPDSMAAAWYAHQALELHYSNERA